MTPGQRYIQIAGRALALAKTAERLVETGALRSAAVRFEQAAQMLQQAADERDIALGRAKPFDAARRQLRASLATLNGCGATEVG